MDENWVKTLTESLNLENECLRGIALLKKIGKSHCEMFLCSLYDSSD